MAQLRVLVPAQATQLAPGEHGWTQLMDAALAGDLERTTTLIRAGANVDAADERGETALSLAAGGGRVDIVSALLSAGANPNTRGADGTTALSAALWMDHPRVALGLIAAGADPNSRSAGGQSVLEVAAIHGELDVIEALLARGASLAADGPDALSAAVWKDHLDVARALIDAGADVNSGSPSPLHFAVGNGARTAVELLLANGAKPTSQDLLDAVGSRRFTIASLLLERFDLGTLRQQDGQRLLSAADAAGADEFARSLLAAGVGARVDDASVQLLFRRAAAEGCELSVFDPRSRAIMNIAAGDPPCPERMFVTSGSKTVLLVRGDAVDAVRLDPNRPEVRFDLPRAQVRRTLVEELQPKINRHYGREIVDASSMRPELAAVGFLENGQPAAAFHVSGPADEVYALLYALAANGWTLAAEQDCNRFDVECPFARLNGRSIDEWPEEREAWHPAIRANRFFAGKEARQRQGSDVTDSVVRFDFGGTLSVLRFATAGSDDSDAVWTGDITLQIGDATPISIGHRSALTSIAGRYLLVRDIDSRVSELYDLGTGQSVLGPLATATWIE